TRFVERILRERHRGGTPWTAPFANGIGGGTSWTAPFANGLAVVAGAAPSSCLSRRTAVNTSLYASCAPSVARTIRQDRHDEDTARDAGARSRRMLPRQRVEAPVREGCCRSSGVEARGHTRRRKMVACTVSAAGRSRRRIAAGTKVLRCVVGPFVMNGTPYPSGLGAIGLRGRRGC